MLKCRVWQLIFSRGTEIRGFEIVENPRIFHAAGIRGFYVWRPLGENEDVCGLPNLFGIPWIKKIRGIPKTPDSKILGFWTLDPKNVKNPGLSGVLKSGVLNTWCFRIRGISGFCFPQNPG